MISEDNEKEQERKLEEMDYSPNEDIFNKENPVRIDSDGNPITGEGDNDAMPYGLDIPGSADDDNFEQIIDQLPVEDSSSNHGNSQSANDLEPDSEDVKIY